MQQRNTIYLPETIINPHSHGRDLLEISKSSINQVMLEAKKGLIDISFFMPNTDPALTNILILQAYLFLIEKAKEELLVTHSQYVFFGVTDSNLDQCQAASVIPEVIGFKVYSKGTTTGGDRIGVARDETIKEIMFIARSFGKVVDFHCDNPDVIAQEGNSIRAEVTDVERILRIAEEVPGVKITICHVSCRESAELIIAAQENNMNVMLEIAPQYLWFDNSGTNWNSSLDAVFYHCFNNLRGPSDRLFMQSLLSRNNIKIIIGADDARHTKDEKVEKRLGGIPSNQEMIPVVCTFAERLGLSKERVGDLLCFNAAEHFGISVSRSFKKYELEERLVDYDYNNGVVINPWKGSKLLFPILN